MALEETMICAGFGARKGVTRDAVLAALDAALTTHDIARDRLDAVATVPRKRDEPGLTDAAKALGLPLVIADDVALQAAATHCLTRSEQARSATGLPSASEAAALAVCGPAGRLLGPRITLDGVTCAIATTGRKS
ncbi:MULTISPECIES: cobalamin biosynthesis protein [Nitratireductor]|uniref:cobalamin biosynthesis protein n=1 Tax=Nitratireductor TaxID=245876 RepID=UPI001FEF0691|nr:MULTISPECIES: cobalamin biosynthesis protein [Nitratireductor]